VFAFAFISSSWNEARSAVSKHHFRLFDPQPLQMNDAENPAMISTRTCGQVKGGTIQPTPGNPHPSREAATNMKRAGSAHSKTGLALSIPKIPSLNIEIQEEPRESFKVGSDIRHP
jgi:hypothetical protein